MKAVICGAGLWVVLLAGPCLAGESGNSPGKTPVAQPAASTVVAGFENPAEGAPADQARGAAAPRRDAARRPAQAGPSEVVFSYDALGRVVEILRPPGK